MNDSILRAFPGFLEKDVAAVLNILPFDVHNIHLAGGSTCRTEVMVFDTGLVLRLGNELLTFPCRVYFNEPDQEMENKLSDTQKAILNCIYLKHHNGYVRERRLAQLKYTDEYWVTPFILHLLGDYVYEILVVVDQHINDQTIEMYRQLIKDNPKYWQQIRSRVASYWDAYYRRLRGAELRDYLGTHIVNRINECSRSPS